MVDVMAETVLRLDGRLESSSVPTFQNQLSQATLLGNERLVLDLSRVSFVGSAALRVILVTAKRLGVSGGRLAVCAAPQIAQVFVVAGLDAVLPVHVSLDDARAALAL
jgi:stage II sporulation protein AA (anti-sigma F factor antagonist)